MRTLTRIITLTLTRTISLRLTAVCFAASIVYVIAFATCATAQVTPSGGLTDGGILQGTTITIGWPRYIDAPSVDIYLWNATTSERHEIAGDVPTSQGEFVWNVPVDIANGPKYRFVVASSNDGSQRMMSRSWVTVGPLGIHKVGPQSALLPSNPSAYEVAHGRVSILPNPANDAVRIRFGSDFVTIRFVSLEGATIVERSLCKGERTVDVDVQHLTSGVYTVVLAAEDGHCISSPLHVVP